MKSSQILREAARLVEQQKEYCGCAAIARAGGTPRYKSLEAMRDYFSLFEPAGAGYFWWPYEEAHGPRIIGLCLAAAIAESEGD